jgi:F-type H+-transporting ATPase subunit delta
MSERNKAYALAIATIATGEGDLAGVQAEFEKVGRLVGASDDLRGRLSDAALPVVRRQQIIEDLLEGRASTTIIAVTSMIVAAGRGRDLPGIAEELANVTAAQSGKQVATVRSAIDLTEDQKQRLATALQAKTGTPVDVRVVIDPSVLGGLVAQVGDTVIDGSVRRKLDQLKQAI